MGFNFLFMHNSLSYVFIFRSAKLKYSDALSLLRIMQFQTEAISLAVDTASTFSQHQRLKPRVLTVYPFIVNIVKFYRELQNSWTFDLEK